MDFATYIDINMKLDSSIKNDFYNITACIEENYSIMNEYLLDNKYRCIGESCDTDNYLYDESIIIEDAKEKIKELATTSSNKVSSFMKNKVELLKSFANGASKNKINSLSKSDKANEDIKIYNIKALQDEYQKLNKELKTINNKIKSGYAPSESEISNIKEKVKRFEKSVVKDSDEIVVDVKTALKMHDDAINNTIKDINAEVTDYSSDDTSTTLSVERDKLNKSFTTKVVGVINTNYKKLLNLTKSGVEKVYLSFDDNKVTTDELTKCKNKSFMSIYKDKLNSEESVVTMVDLNSFKALNDNYGHAAGDKLLEMVGKHLIKVAGNKGHAIRNGGDEFVLITQSFSPSMLTSANFKFDVPGKGTYDVKGTDLFSYGSVKKPSGVSVSETLKKCDDKMYKYKEEYYKRTKKERRK